MTAGNEKIKLKIPFVKKGKRGSVRSATGIQNFSLSKSPLNKFDRKKTKPSVGNASDTPKKESGNKQMKSDSEKSAPKRTKCTKRAVQELINAKPTKRSSNKSTFNSPKTDKEKSSSRRKKKDAPAIVFPKTTWGVDSIVGFEATEQLPPPHLTSIAGGFVFQDDKVILANVPGRGWEIIGGRIDIGESPDETFRREALNQIGVNLSQVKMIGVVRIEHTGPEPPNCPYPHPVGYGVQYIGIASDLLPFTGGSDSLGRSLITPDGFKEHYYGWNEYFDAVFHYAFSVYKKWRKKLKM
jgi:8-oxo-dGTP pyrophosphatase MutT (NUDIX family)